MSILNIPKFFWNLISSAINRIDALLKRNKQKKKIEENEEYSEKIDKLIEDNLINDINKELGWDKEDES
jgi:hypothetical protein